MRLFLNMWTKQAENVKLKILLLSTDSPLANMNELNQIQGWTNHLDLPSEDNAEFCHLPVLSKYVFVERDDWLVFAIWLWILKYIRGNKHSLKE